MISSHPSNVPKDVIFPDCFEVIGGDPRIQATYRRSQLLPGLWLALSDMSPILPHLSLSLSAACWLVVGTPRLVSSTPRCSHVHPMFSPTLWCFLKLITITPMLLLYQSPEIRVTPKASWNALLWSDTLLKLTPLSLYSTSSQTLLEAPSNKIKFCWFTST